MHTIVILLGNHGYALRFCSKYGKVRRKAKRVLSFCLKMNDDLYPIISKKERKIKREQEY